MSSKYKGYWPKVHSTPEEMQARIMECDARIAEAAELGRLYRERKELEKMMKEMALTEKKSLRNRLNEGPAPLSLKDRLDLSSAPRSLTLIDAYKHKHLLRHQEAQKLVKGVAKVIDHLEDLLIKDDRQLPEVIKHFYVFNATLSVKVVKKMTNRHWRYLRRDCRNIKLLGKIKDVRQIEAELKALSKQCTFVYNKE